MTTTDPLAIAQRAIQLYAETHPRPAHVNMKQAADMLGCGIYRVRSLIRAGTLKLNGCGMIPIAGIQPPPVGGRLE